MRCLALLALLGTADASVRGAHEEQQSLASGSASAARAGSAFATLCAPSTIGQNCEHERITAYALACKTNAGMPNCFERFSIELLAGSESKSTFGAVGTPDNPAAGFLNDDLSHCDNSDLSDANLVRCRSRMITNLNAAVTAAGRLLDTKGVAVMPYLPPDGTDCDCGSRATSQYAKCTSLCSFGKLLHASEASAAGMARLCASSLPAPCPLLESRTSTRTPTGSTIPPRAPSRLPTPTGSRTSRSATGSTSGRPRPRSPSLRASSRGALIWARARPGTSPRQSTGTEASARKGGASRTRR